MRVIAHQHDTLDALLWRHMGRTGGVLEQALATRPGLADLGVVLPHGAAVDIPDDARREPTPLIQLWN